MEKIDTAAAENLQNVFDKLRNGPWHTGSTGAKGAVITEPLICTGAATDNIKRYTDKYIQTKTIGRTVDTYLFNPQFLPRELYKAAGIKSEAAQQEDGAKPKAGGIDVKAIQNGNFDETEEGDKSDGDENKEAEPEEDEFEELEDDDYNAEKYFDDGEEFGDGDDGDDEAAY